MRSIIVTATATVTLFSSPAAFTQQPDQGAASIPDFSGTWSHPYVWGFELPPSGSGPVVSKARLRQIFDADGRPQPAANAPLVGDPRRPIGDYTNPILKPEAAEVVKEHGEITLTGRAIRPLPTSVGPVGAFHFLDAHDDHAPAAGQDHNALWVIMNSARCA
jgi:hypothetical protein